MKQKIFILLVIIATFGALYFIIAPKTVTKKIQIGKNTNINQPNTGVKAVQESLSQDSLPASQDQSQSNSNQSAGNSDTQPNLKFTLPTGFVESGQAYTYDKYFDNQSKGVEISVEISKGEYASISELQNQAKTSGVNVSNVVNLTVNGVSATQQLEDNTKSTDPQNKDCALSTYFEKNGKMYQISLYSDTSCDSVNAAKADYDSFLNSFQD
jgi:hypothetical protein